ncbi:hypothetical protein C8R43DRAFT_960688 [Mycena crocata]|nr:hypothetical protein C8R43DRAFT_960688 [Mycena crocata]
MSKLGYPLFRIAAFRPPHGSTQRPSSRAYSSGLDIVDRIRRTNLDLLLDSLRSNGNPSRVWANYTNLLTLLGSDRLPLEIHQEVLRKCTPSNRLLRVSATRRLFAGNVPRVPHMYESRLQAVIRNIRASGEQPVLDDYHFILEQFAAVGHHFGAMQVYRELAFLNLAPRIRTFGLCLQAIAHRLTLPVSRQDETRRIAVTRRMVSDLVDGMKSFNVPFTSVNLDLTMRILKETTDMQGFEMLMKWGYGIDLANPDRPPLEHLGSSSGDAGSTVKGPTFQPFSTAALNTTIDTLGRLNNISRMVQAFEVLTTPLPRRSISSVSYEEDDDDDYGAIMEPTATLAPPFAAPNTTTYNILIRHVSQAGHGTFARHYLKQAIELERQGILDLNRQLGHLPLQEIPSPHFAINRGTLLPVYGDANRNKNLTLMRWLCTKLSRILSRKRGHVKNLKMFREPRRKRRLWPYDDPSTYTQFTLPSYPKRGGGGSAPASPEEPKSRPSRYTTIMDRWKAPKGVGDVFDVDLENESTPSPSLKNNTLNLDLHIAVLERDISEIEALQRHALMVVERTARRVQERIGRRVWKGKDIYLRSQGARVRIGKDSWERIASLKPLSGERRWKERHLFPWSDPANQRAAPRTPRPHPADSTQSDNTEPSQPEGTKPENEAR